MTRLHRLLIGSIFVAALPLSAHAGSELGGSVGSARVNEGQFQGNDTSYKIFLGTAYQDIIGVEAGYNNFGKLGGGNGPDAKAWSAAGTLGAPYLFDFITPYGKGGIAWEDVGGTNGSAVTQGYKDRRGFYGLGVRFAKLGSPLGIRVEYERFMFRDQHLDLASAGLEFRFWGGREPY
jgi:hypothetical protein